MDQELLRALSAITPEEQSLLQGDALTLERYVSSRKSVVDSAKMLEKGRLITIRPHTRFCDFPRHSHNYIEMTYVCSGSMTHIVNDTDRITVQAGELLLLNQHAFHAIERADEGDVAVNFIILPEFFDVALGMIGPENMLADFLMNSLKQDADGVSCLHFAVADVLPVQSIVESMVWSLAHHQPNSRRINQVSMGLLLLHLLNFTERIRAPQSAPTANAIVMDVMRLVEEQYKTASLSEVAARHHVSLAYISKVVRLATGSTYKELLQQKRLTRTQQLLMTSHLSVQEVMAAVGYSNSSYFYRIFRQQFGIAPGDMRKSASTQKPTP